MKSFPFLIDKGIQYLIDLIVGSEIVIAGVRLIRSSGIG